MYFLIMVRGSGGGGGGAIIHFDDCNGESELLLSMLYPKAYCLNNHH